MRDLRLAVSLGAKPVVEAAILAVRADAVCEPGELTAVVRRHTRSLHYGDQLTGGADHVFDCVGTSTSVTKV